MIKGAADICINKCKYYHEFDNSVNQINNEKIQNIISIIEGINLLNFELFLIIFLKDLSSEGLKVLCFCYKYILSESKFGKLKIKILNNYFSLFFKNFKFEDTHLNA